MNRKVFWIFCFISFLFAFTGISRAQVNDAAAWASINIEKKITRKFAVHFSEEARFNENVTELGTLFSEFVVEYKLATYFTVSGGYRFILKRQMEDYMSKRHRILVNFNGKYKIGKINLNGRARLQSQYTDYNSSEDGKVPDNHLRLKLTAKPSLPKKYTPFVSGEAFYHLNNPDGVLFDNYRVAAGIEYEFTKNASLELFYMIDREVNVKEPVTSYVFGAGYNIVF